MHITDRLNEIATFYEKESWRYLKSRGYLAATIMQVSALEAALQAMCFIYSEGIKRTAIFRQTRFKRARYRALEIKLYELIEIANELGWFPAKKLNWGKRANLAGFAHEIRKLRNFVHPGVWARERKPTKFTRTVYGVILEVFEVTTSWLLHRIEKSLRRRMAKEGLL